MLRSVRSLWRSVSWINGLKIAGWVGLELRLRSCCLCLLMNLWRRYIRSLLNRFNVVFQIVKSNIIHLVFGNSLLPWVCIFNTSSQIFDLILHFTNHFYCALSVYLVPILVRRRVSIWCWTKIMWHQFDSWIPANAFILFAFFCFVIEMFQVTLWAFTLAPVLTWAFSLILSYRSVWTFIKFQTWR